MSRIPRFLQVLGVNAVPVVGVVGAGWTEATALALYWCENLLVIALVALRIWLHRRATGKRGHWEAPPPASSSTSARSGSFLAGFLTPALAFTAGHAIFLGMILFLVLPHNFPEAAGVDPDTLGIGLLVIGVFLLGGFLFDLVGLEHRTFHWIQLLAGRVLGRVVLVHLTIIFGMLGMAWLDGPRGFFIVFAGFKTLADLGSFLGSESHTGDEPPGCVLGVVRVFGGKGKAGEFAKHHREHSAEERKRAEGWEKRRVT